jgi:hypothetical protein
MGEWPGDTGRRCPATGEYLWYGIAPRVGSLSICCTLRNPAPWQAAGNLALIELL